MHANTLPRLCPALLLTFGPGGEAIAGQTLALGREWLGQPPPAIDVGLTPAALVDPLQAATLAALADACDRLADAGPAAQLAQAGWQLDAAEITAWLIIEDSGVLTLSGADGRPRQDFGEPSRVTEDSGSTTPPITLAATLADLAWRRLRAHVTLHALLLTEPAAEDGAATWAARLATAGVTPVGLVGPINADRRRWAPPIWQRQAAVSLAALLWSDATLGSGQSATGALTTAEPAPAFGIGAAAWPTPRTELKRQLMPRGLRLVIACLLRAPPATAEMTAAEEADLPPWELPALTVAPERHRLSLVAAIPPAPSGLVWGRRRPDFWALATVPDTLRAAVDTRATQAHDAQFESRGAWLERQIATWTTALDRLSAERLARPDGWPELRRYCVEMQTLTTRLRAASARIEDWLEAAGTRFTQAEAEVTRAAGDLAELCGSFPAANRAGLLATLAQPWRWPRLVWAYLLQLPQSAQKYLDACARRGEARWAEANVHALRQTYLAMAQDVQTRQREVDALLLSLSAVDGELACELEALGEPPAPWDAHRLDKLAQQLTDTAPGPGLDLAAARDRLCAWATARLAPLDDWTAADWLTQSLDHDALARWLDDFAGHAAPLWPITTPEAETIAWLICPRRPRQTPDGDDAAEERLRAALGARRTQEAAGDAGLRYGRCYGDALVILRGVKVGLEHTG